MQENNMIDFLSSLKDMSSAQLSRLIQEETAKELPNDDLVLMALDVLEDREKAAPVNLGPKGMAAWEKYQSKVRARQRKTIRFWKPLMRVASVLLVITLLFALLPTRANAETWWERLARWTDDFFSFFNPNESEKPENEYVFQTDNEGLQQLYDAVVELGITDPIIPMWLPDGYELEYIINNEMPGQRNLVALFVDEKSEVVIFIRLLNDEVPYQYHKDETEVNIYEKYGTTFSILQNNNKNIMTWSIENVECSLSIDCQEDTLYKIIESIYRWR